MLNTVVKNPRSVVNFIVLVAKQYLYAQRCLKLPVNVIEFKAKIKFYKDAELYIARKNNHVNKHLNKWSLFC